MFDLKLPCKECGSKVCLFYINLTKGVVSCSNEDCKWPFEDDNLKIIPLNGLPDATFLESLRAEYGAITATSNVTSKHSVSETSHTNTADCSMILENFKQNSADSITTMTSFTSPTNQKSSDVANLSDLESLDEYKLFKNEKKEKAFRFEDIGFNDDNIEEDNMFSKPDPVDEDEALQKIIKRAHIKYTASKQPVFKNPKLIQNLKKLEKLKNVNKKPQQFKKPLIKPAVNVNIEINSENGVIQLEYKNIEPN